MNKVSFHGSETAGSIGKRSVNNIRKTPIQPQEPACDTVSFRGRDYDDRPSFGSTLFKGAASIAVVIGALGLAHKKNVFGKLKNANLKKYINKATEPCYNICHKTKELVISLLNKIKGKFSK